MSLFVLDTAGDKNLLESNNAIAHKNALSKSLSLLDTKVKQKLDEALSTRSVEVLDEGENEDEYFGLPPPSVDIREIINDSFRKQSKVRSKNSAEQELAYSKASINTMTKIAKKKSWKPPKVPYSKIDHSDFNPLTNIYDNDAKLVKIDVDKELTSTGVLSSILKAYSATQREKAKSAAVNKVRFELPRLKGLLDVVKAVREDKNYLVLTEFVEFLQQIELTTDEFITMYTDARKVCAELSPKFTNLVEALLGQQWTKRSPEAVQVYLDFALDLLVAHNKYAHFLVPKLIMLWIPADNEEDIWHGGTPNEEKSMELKAVHDLLARIVIVIPMTFDLVLEVVDSKFPYFKKAPHTIGGFVHNLILLMERQPTFAEFIMQILLQKLVILDVNAPRSEIEDAECQDEDEEEWEEDLEADEDEEQNNNAAEEGKFHAKNEPKDESPMNHPIAHTLDICMEKLFSYLHTKKPNHEELEAAEVKKQNESVNKFFKIMRTTFDNVLLPCHNTHHVQFLMFYYCSFKQAYAEAFLVSLLDKVRDPNASAIIRQTSVGYIASFLARAKYLTHALLRFYIKELCDWAHQYIERCDQYRSNGSLKANIVFFSVCQAIFYVIAFRSRSLTSDKKDLLFLQSLRLSALVTCNFNPLRYCLPAVATAFAGVTRAHQLAYCHAVLERNARRKLATVYTNGTETAEDTLDIFFPFDPYLLKFSNVRIQSIYLQYQPSAAEEHSPKPTEHQEHSATRRKRTDSEMFDGEDMDDFLLAEKRKKNAHNIENKFSFGMGIDVPYYP